MITFRNKIDSLRHQCANILEASETHLYELIELKRACDNVSEIISSLYDDIVVDINK